MPATVTTQKITPKSVLRHRTIGSNTISLDHPTASRASRTIKRPRHADPIPCWKVIDRPASLPRKQQTAHWFLTITSGMLIAFLIIMIGQFIFSWLGTVVDTIHYGYPRTFQTDAFVGHEKNGQPSHFVAVNLKGHIEIIELPGGDAAHARIFVGPQLYGPNADLQPVTLQFVPPPGSHTPDMHVLFQSTTLVFHNRQGTFVAGP